jgi:hypothetical protein
VEVSVSRLEEDGCRGDGSGTFCASFPHLAELPSHCRS